MFVSIYLFPGDQSVIQVREQSNISSILRRYIHPTHLYSTHTFIPRRYFILYSGGISTQHTYTVHIHFTRDLGAPDTYHIIEICLSYIFLKLINEVAFLITTGKLFHLLITLKLKKFILISKLHSFELRFILHVENLALLGLKLFNSFIISCSRNAQVTLL